MTPITATTTSVAPFAVTPVESPPLEAVPSEPTLTRLPVREPDGAWRVEAACRGLDPMIFHPSDEDPAFAAKAVCSECPVREACLDHAIVSREKDGVWGGLTAIERRRLVRRLRRRSA